MSASSRSPSESRPYRSEPQGSSDACAAFRNARTEDEPLLWLMLTHAAQMGPGGELYVPIAKADPDLRGHVEGWGRIGDVGIIALDSEGREVGAAWVRLGDEGRYRFKYSDERIPELAIAVDPTRRGCGVGTAMLDRLLDLCRSQFPGVLLSVREDNPAILLYRRAGFRTRRKVLNRVGGTSLIMQLDFA